MESIWKVIIVFNRETEYEVSNYGLVRMKNTKTFLEPKLDSEGYQQVVLYIDMVPIVRYVHKLVAEAFIPSEGKHQILHINGNKENNSVNNLKWVDSISKIIAPKPEKAKSKYKYGVEIAHKICELLEKGGMTNKEIAYEVGTNTTFVSEVKCRRRMREVSCQYNFPEAQKRYRIEENQEEREHSKYDAEKIHTVCKLLEDNQYTLKRISEVTGVGVALVSAIKYKKAWTHISDLYNIQSNGNSGEKHYASKHSNDQIHEVCRLLKERKYSSAIISKLTGVSEKTISDIKRGYSWRSISSQYGL